MAEKDSKIQGITGTLTPLMLTERDDDYSLNVTTPAKCSFKDIYQLTSNKNSKYTAAQYESMYMELFETAKAEVYPSSTVKFGFTYNSLGVDGPFISTKPVFDPTTRRI